MITMMPMMMTYIKDSLYDDYHGVIRIPTTVVIELEVAFDDHNDANDDDVYKRLLYMMIIME